MTEENLLLDINDPFSMYQSQNNILTDASSGSAYKEIYNREHSHPYPVVSQM